VKYTIEIEVDNDAFFNPEGNHDACAEVASILESLCLRHLRAGNDQPTSLFDSNGNKVGRACFTGRAT
jgi:hypothetical protein